MFNLDRYNLQGIAALVVGIVIGAYMFSEREAHADPTPGLWAEQSTVADGVLIRKIRDTTGHDYNVCYIASHIASHIDDTNGQWSKTPAVSISCVPERKP